MRSIWFSQSTSHIVHGKTVSIGLAEDGQYYATHNSCPYFCLPADSLSDAIARAEYAFMAYDGLEGER
jgi:nitrite reductase/ring-hydroxylating ferredoxin subunit